MATNVLGNLFETVGRVAENGYEDFRVVYLRNTNTTLTAEEVGIVFQTPNPEIVIVDTKKTPNENVAIVQDYPYVQADPGNSINKVFGNIYIGVHSAKNVEVPTLASTTTAPTGVTFTQPVLNSDGTLDGDEIVIPDLGPTDYIAIYLDRQILQGAVGKNVATAAITTFFSSSE